MTPCHRPRTCVCRTTAPEKNTFLKSGRFIVCLFVLFFRHVCVINKASFQCSRLRLAVPEDSFGICSRRGYRTAETSLLVHKLQVKKILLRRAVGQRGGALPYSRGRAGKWVRLSWVSPGFPCDLRLYSVGTDPHPNPLSPQ